MTLTHILKRPIVTEKSMSEVAQNRYTFEVDVNATKGQIGKAVKETFGVEVLSVETIKIAGKRRRVGRLRREVKKSDKKKAIVEVKKGQKIDVFESQT